MESKKISVIIPVYNIQDYLKKCVDSVLNQTYRNLQVVLVDDGSKDQSAEICDFYEKTDPRVMVIHKENGGVSSARNAGVEKADGDYITFVDSDDYLEPEMYERLLGAAEEYSLDVASCGYFHTEEPQKLPLTEGVQILNTEKAMEYCIADDFNSTMCGAVWNKLYRAEKLKQYLFFPLEYIIGEDMLVTIRCLMHAENIGQLNWCGYHYIQRENSAVNSFKKNKSSSVPAHREMYEELKKDYPKLAERVMVRSVEQSYCLIREAICSEKLYKDDIAVLREDLNKNGRYVRRSCLITGADRVMCRLYAKVPGITGIFRWGYRLIKRNR